MLLYSSVCHSHTVIPAKSLPSNTIRDRIPLRPANEKPEVQTHMGIMRGHSVADIEKEVLCLGHRK